MLSIHTRCVDMEALVSTPAIITNRAPPGTMIQHLPLWASYGATWQIALLPLKRSNFMWHA